MWTMNENGCCLKKLTTSSKFDGRPAYSPDGTKVVYSTTRVGNFDIWTVKAGGGGEVALITNAATDDRPDWQSIHS